LINFAFTKIIKNKNMGEIRVKMELENLFDRELFERGDIKENQVRHTEIDALADTGAVEMLIPQDIAEKLGLRFLQTVTVTLADDSKKDLWRASALQITVCNRKLPISCLVGPTGCEPLLGQVVMESLDLVLSPSERTITPNPKSPNQPTLKMK
jgi:clan AA aspartic protease